jgi:hypothetical protein
MNEADMDLVALVEAHLAAKDTCIAELEAAFKSQAQLSGEVIEDRNKRIAELEHQLEIRKAAIEAQFKLMAQVKELEKALRHFAEFPLEDFGWQAKGPSHPITGFNSWKLQVVHITEARKVLGL